MVPSTPSIAASCATPSGFGGAASVGMKTGLGAGGVCPLELDVRDDRVRWTEPQAGDEHVKVVLRAFCDYFDAPVCEVLDVAPQVQVSGVAPDEGAVADSLDVARDDGGETASAVRVGHAGGMLATVRAR